MFSYGLVILATDEELVLFDGCLRRNGSTWVNWRTPSAFYRADAAPEDDESPWPLPAAEVRWAPAYRFRRDRIVRFEVSPAWPSVDLYYRGPDVEERHVLGTASWPGLHPPKASIEESETLEALVAWARETALEVSGSGWLDAPEVSWERASMPKRRSVTPDEALGYRDSARPEELAWTTPLEPHERLLRWMVWRRLGKEWPIPEEVAVDRQHVFVRPAGSKPEEAFLLPLSALRWREDHGVDAIYVFGRHTRLPMLGRRAGCPVRERLDQALRGT